MVFMVTSEYYNKFSTDEMEQYLDKLGLSKSMDVYIADNTSSRDASIRKYFYLYTLILGSLVDNLNLDK
jgi:hypothetical protein